MANGDETTSTSQEKGGGKPASPPIWGPRRHNFKNKVTKQLRLDPNLQK